MSIRRLAQILTTNKYEWHGSEDFHRGDAKDAEAWLRADFPLMDTNKREIRFN